jgi:hypothetical protein
VGGGSDCEPALRERNINDIAVTFRPLMALGLSAISKKNSRKPQADRLAWP